MDFRVLGTVGAWSDGQRLPTSGSLRTALLALLLLRANRVVPAGWLIDTLWESAPPRTATTGLQVMVHHLRRALGRDQERLLTEPPGYLLTVAERELDLDVFTALTAQARAALAERSYADAARILREALLLWRGPVLGGATPVRLLRDEAGRLEEQRLSTLEDRFGADLALGAGAELVGELAAALAVRPDRQRLRGQLMLALHRSGRTAEALATYRQGRALLIRDLGIEPAAVLQALHSRMLRDDPDLLTGPDGWDDTAGRTAAQPAATAARHAAGQAATARVVAGQAATARIAAGHAATARPAVPAPPRPAQLPHDVAQFTGRRRELAVLAALCLPPQGEPARTVPGPAATAATGVTPVVAIDGMPGVGKTALALHFAHMAADRFPDGQLYVNLHGFEPGHRPTDPGGALYHILTSLGVPPSAMPAGTDERAALYRSMVTGKRILLVIDNAATVDQVRPLLPGGAGCRVLVTSRNRLAGLVVQDGARLLAAAALPADDGLALLTAILGRERVAAEPAAAQELVRVSGCLPLALRISAASLLMNPDRGIADVVADVSSDRLDALHLDGDEDSAVRLAFDGSYRSLPAAASRLFRLLGLVPGADICTAAAAALARTTLREVTADLNRLAAAHLVERPAPDRWRQHDLLRWYAAERAGREEPPQDRDRAIDGLLRHYLAAAERAAALIYPQPPTAAGPDGSSPTPPGRAPSPPAAAPPGPDASFPTPPGRGPSPPAAAPPGPVRPAPPPPAWPPVPPIDDAAGAVAWFDAERANLVAAVRHAAGDNRNPLAWQLADGMARMFLLRHHLREWIGAGTAALGAAERAGDADGVAHMHLGLGNAYYSAGDPAEAAEHYARAIEHAGRAGWPAGLAAARANLGVVHASAGRTREALRHFTRALRLQRRLGNRHGEAVALDNIGGIHYLLGHLTQALTRHRRALLLHRQNGFRAGEALALANMGNAERELGRLGDALDHCAQALQIYVEIGSRTGQAQALCCLADIHLDGATAVGSGDEAEPPGGRAGTPGGSAGPPGGTAGPAGTPDGVNTRSRALGEAEAAANRALAVTEECGDRRTMSEALNILGAVCAERGRLDLASGHHERALRLAARTGYDLEIQEALHGLAEIGRREGRYAGALAHIRRAVRIARDGERVIAEPALLITLARIHLDRGAPGAAACHLRRAVRISRATGQHRRHAQAARLLGG